MKVLYALVNYPKLSESYVAAELRYVRAAGVDAQVWAPAVGTKGAPELVKTHRGSLEQALSDFKPDVIHAHYALDSWIRVLRPAILAGIPITIRGHSFEFDIARVNALCAVAPVRRIWLFPHFAWHFSNVKTRPMVVAFDSTRYGASNVEKDLQLVVRTAAGKPNKGLRDFIAVAKRCPDFRFKLVVDRVDNEFDEFIDYLANRAEGSQVEILRSIPDQDVTDLMARAGIYLETSDSDGHPFGMPISIAEAMATGSYVVARWSPNILRYMDRAGCRYTTVDEASVMINTTLGRSKEIWECERFAAIEQSKKFEDVSVLPALVEDWREIAGKQ